MSIKTMLVLLLFSFPAAVFSQVSDSWHRGGMTCPVLDMRADPMYTMGLGLALPARIKGGDKLGLLEWDLNAELLYFRDVLLGDIDLRMDVMTTFLLNRARLDLPYQLMAMSLDSRWTWRYVNNTALQIQAAPGFYAELEGFNSKSVAMPMAITGMKTFDPTLTAVAGFSIRPGFERLLMPIAGAVWQPFHNFRVEALLPASRIILHATPTWSGYLGWAWESMTYGIPDDSLERRKLTLEAQRMTAGVTRALNAELRFTGEVGLLTDRSLGFDRVPADTRDEWIMNSVLYLRIGVGGAF